MAKRLAASFVTLVYEATLKSFWRRNALARFLRQAGVAQTFVSSWGSQESKRQFLDRAESTRTLTPENALGFPALEAANHPRA